jgi:hypothetical protein
MCACVRVLSEARALSAELARFLTFVRSVTDTIEKASNVPVPDYVKLRWESRSKGAHAPFTPSPSLTHLQSCSTRSLFSR